MNMCAKICQTLLALGLLALCVVPAQAKIDKAAQARNWAVCERLLKDTKADVPSQLDAVKAMSGLLDYEHAIKLLAYWQECDKAGIVEKDAKGNPKKGEKEPRPKEAYKIAMQILTLVKNMGEPEEALKFKPDITNRKQWPLRVRMAMLDAIAGNSDHEESIKYVLSLAREGTDTDMRVLAFTALLPHTQREGVFDLALNSLNDKSWRVRDVAIDLVVECASMDKDRAILALINRLSVEEGKLRLNLSKALKKLTNQDLGTDADAWIDWYKEAKRAEQGLPPKKGGDKGATRARRIFGADTFSDRYIFVIDASVSMTERIPPEELEQLKKTLTKDPNDPDKRRPLDWSKINCKLDLAREEMIRSLEVLDPKQTHFTIISFADDIATWSDELKPCDKANVEDAAKWLRGLKGARKTNVGGALDAAFDLSERLAGIDPEKLKKKEKGVVTGKHPDEFVPDTIFFYSDGYSTTGKWGGSSDELKKMANGGDVAAMYRSIMTDFLKEVADRNRVARITINTVGVGRQDGWFLGKLAKDHGGTYLPLAVVK